MQHVTSSESINWPNGWSCSLMNICGASCKTVVLRCKPRTVILRRSSSGFSIHQMHSTLEWCNYHVGMLISWRLPWASLMLRNDDVILQRSAWDLTGYLYVRILMGSGRTLTEWKQRSSIFYKMQMSKCTEMSYRLTTTHRYRTAHIHWIFCKNKIAIMRSYQFIFS